MDGYTPKMYGGFMSSEMRVLNYREHNDGVVLHIWNVGRVFLDLFVSVVQIFKVDFTRETGKRSRGGQKTDQGWECVGVIPKTEEVLVFIYVRLQNCYKVLYKSTDIGNSKWKIIEVKDVQWSSWHCIQ